MLFQSVYHWDFCNNPDKNFLKNISGNGKKACYESQVCFQNNYKELPYHAFIHTKLQQVKCAILVPEF